MSFFKLTTQTSAGTKWEAFKAFLRGHTVLSAILGQNQKRLVRNDCSWNKK